VDDFAVAHRNQLVLVAMDEQRRRIIRGNMHDRRIVRRLLLLEVQRGKTFGPCPLGWRRSADPARKRPKIYWRKISYNRRHAVALSHELLGRFGISVVR